MKIEHFAVLAIAEFEIPKTAFMIFLELVKNEEVKIGFSELQNLLLELERSQLIKASYSEKRKYFTLTARGLHERNIAKAGSKVDRQNILKIAAQSSH